MAQFRLRVGRRVYLSAAPAPSSTEDLQRLVSLRESALHLAFHFPALAWRWRHRRYRLDHPDRLNPQLRVPSLPRWAPRLNARDPRREKFFHWHSPISLS